MVHFLNFLDVVSLRRRARMIIPACIALAAGVYSAAGQSPKPAPQTFPPALVESGKSVFSQKCAFCHGRDAGGGETGPDLTRSKLTGEDVAGDKIGPVVTNGRTDKGM